MVTGDRMRILRRVGKRAAAGRRARRPARLRPR